MSNARLSVKSAPRSRMLDPPLRRIHPRHAEIGRGPHGAALPRQLEHPVERRAGRRQPAHGPEFPELAADEGDRRVGLRRAVGRGPHAAGPAHQRADEGRWQPERQPLRRARAPSCMKSSPSPEVPRYQPRLSNDRAAAVKRTVRMRESMQDWAALVWSVGHVPERLLHRGGALDRPHGERPGDGSACRRAAARNQPPRGPDVEPAERDRSRRRRCRARRRARRPAPRAEARAGSAPSRPASPSRATGRAGPPAP